MNAGSLPSMPAEILINLIGQEDLSHTPQGRIVQWAMTYGRYMIILTEVIVLAAFVSRFTLDRKLTDLKEEITQKQAIIEANAELEMQIRTVQAQTDQVKKLIDGQAQPINILTLVESFLPLDVYLESLDIKQSTLNAKATAKTTGGFAQLLANLKSLKQLTNVGIGSVERTPLVGIQFDIKANIGPQQPAEPKAAEPKEKE